jgi:streptogramin lyase
MTCRRVSAIACCRALAAGALVLPFAVLTGCGIGPVATTSSVSLSLQGRVHGGNQPVAGATVQLYEMGTATASVNGVPVTPNAVPLIPTGSYYPGGQGGCVASGTVVCNPTVVTDALGNFSITGDYTCNPGSGQVYIAALQGNPGLSPGTNNPALSLIAPLGTCGNLSSSTNVFINEVTTVAAAWALAPFMTSYSVAGATATNANGVANAFLDSQLLVDVGSGMAATNASNLTIETGKLYALADAIASCVNSDGTTACGPLFAAATPSSGVKPTDTFGAALSIVKNPGQNVAAVYQLASPFSPFPSTLTQSPNDWTMSLNITGGGLDMPTAMAIDQVGNVWVTGQAGPLAEFSPQGTPLSGTGYGLGTSEITQADSLVVDTAGNIWIADYNSTYNGAGAVTKFLGSSSGSPGTVVTGTNGHPTFYDGGLSYPSGLSADTNGNIFIANNGSSSVTIYNSSGQDIAASLGANDNLYGEPQAVAVDSSHGFWLSNSDYTVAHIDQYGNLLSHPTCCDESYGLATDSLGNVWVASYLNDAISEIGPSSSTPLISAFPYGSSTPDTGAGGLRRPAQVAIDAAQNVWVTNLYGNSITELAGAYNSLGAGTPISPTTGVYTTGGYGLDAGLANPYSIVPDTAGNVWVSNEGATKVTMFFGLATPTVTPISPVPTAP